MLGFAIATFVSLLLAIALRDFFIRLFLVMVLCFVAYLAMAAYIGSVQLRRQTEVSVARRTSSSERAGQAVQSSAVAEAEPLIEPQPVVHQPSVLFPEVSEDNTLEEYDALRGVFDDDFFEPIPELTFEPLNLDASVLDPSQSQKASLFGDDDDKDSSGEFFEQLVGRDNTGDYFAIDDDGWIAEPVFEGEELAVDPILGDSPMEFDAELDTEVVAEAATAEDTVVDEAEDRFVDEAVDEAAEAERREATFIAAPVQRQRPPKRNKARPIYIESQLDEGDEEIKAVND